MVASLRKAGLRDDVDRAGELASVYANGVCVCFPKNMHRHISQRAYSRMFVFVCVCFFLEASCVRTLCFVIFLEFRVQNQRTAGSIDFDESTIFPFPL